MTSPCRFFLLMQKNVLATGYLVVLGALPSLLSMAAAVWLVSSWSDLADARWGCIFTGFNGTPKIWENMGEIHQKRRNIWETHGENPPKMEVWMEKSTKLNPYDLSISNPYDFPSSCYHLVIKHGHGKLPFLTGKSANNIYKWTMFHGYVK